MTDKLIERLEAAQLLYEQAGLNGENGAKIMVDAKARILADAKIIKAAAELAGLVVSVISDLEDIGAWGQVPLRDALSDYRAAVSEAKQ